MLFVFQVWPTTSTFQDELAGGRTRFAWRGNCTLCLCTTRRRKLPVVVVKISDICGEMNPFGLSALEEMNLLFTLMVSSTVMVDIVFAGLIYCTFYWR